MPPKNPVRDRHIARTHPLLSPAQLRRDAPLTDRGQEIVIHSRDAVSRILDGEDDRLFVVVGPCSIHDPEAGLDYARRLADLSVGVAEELLVIMRVYFEKPRTTIGWKGLINDPALDGSFKVDQGLSSARRLLVDILEMGLPVGCEFLDPILPQYLADTVTWGAIGARTAESQIHRQLAAGLSMPVGIKNSTSGDVQVALDAIGAASSAQVFIGIDDGGRAAILTTTGNPDCHVVLRGSTSGPNCDPATVAQTLDRLSAVGLPRRVVIDASHGNSAKDHRRQLDVIADVSARIRRGEQGIVGMMLESFLVPGRQDLVVGRKSELAYGQSVTDACIGWDETVGAVRQLASAMSERRELVATALSAS